MGELINLDAERARRRRGQLGLGGNAGQFVAHRSAPAASDADLGVGVGSGVSRSDRQQATWDAVNRWMGQGMFVADSSTGRMRAVRSCCDEVAGVRLFDEEDRSIGLVRWGEEGSWETTSNPDPDTHPGLW